ncbi:MAG TPA: hypothetical protein VEW07_02005 [Solirubrobacterales bacterium]|nr:hypothetical protein [Solirubrobacterales bacterium]
MTALGGEAQIRVPAQAGEPCEQCGSPLAADQRYCLNCGRRRGAPRVDYRERMAAAGAAAADREAPATPSVNGAQPQPAEQGRRDYAPLAAVGGIAVLGLMLLVGVLIGRGDGGTTTTPAPVVVQGAGTAQPSASDTGGDGGAGGGGGAGLGASAGGKAKSQNAKDGGEKAADDEVVTAGEDDLAGLESETGEEAAKNALKLPDKIATPGAPPPIDKSKAPGGGEGGAVTIK